jgi:transcriptional regulator with XRE-family HTH domain
MRAIRIFYEEKSVSLASKLLKLRQESGESLQGVADSVGASRAHVWEVETGRTKNPSLDLIRRLADHFKVSVAWLVGEIPDEKSDNKAAALYRTLQSLSPQNQQHIQAIIDSMQKTGNE